MCNQMLNILLAIAIIISVVYSYKTNNPTFFDKVVIAIGFFLVGGLITLVLNSVK